MPSYKVSFPDIEINATHGRSAIDQAIKQLKENQKDFPLLPAHEITWIETHDEQCDCNTCMEKTN